MRPPLPVAILAGGLATRLHPITHTVPKALVDVAGRPFIDWQLRQLRAQGVRQVCICAGFLGEQVQAFVGAGERWGLALSFSFDGPRLLGTGGALRQAAGHLGEAFFVLYGDSYLPISFAAVQDDFDRQGLPALMTVLKNNGQWDRSNVDFTNGRLVEYNKRAPRAQMAYIDYGLGVLRADVLQARPEGDAFDLADVYHELSLQGQLAGHEVFERFYEIGSHQGLRETADYLKKENT
jgi:NDP-sugar pyrophosphorylase family protein